MASNPSQPDHLNPQQRRDQQPISTAGEFTQIFSDHAAVESETQAQAYEGTAKSLPFSPVQDDFASKFSAAPLPLAAPLRDSRADEATLIFEALPPMPASISPPPQVAAPSRVAQNSASEFTQIFTPIAPPAAPEPRPSALPSSEFTQVFTAIAPPATPPPAVKPTPRPAAGEFTQFFSAISERENVATKPPENERAVSPPSVAPAAAVPQAGAFTQLFQAPPAPVQAVTPPPKAEAGSFTQVFQPLAPPSRNAQEAVPIPVRAQAKPSVDFASPAPAASSDWPAFGPPPPASGTFTDVFATQRPLPPAATSPWTAPSQQSSQPPPQSEDFTELFQPVPPPQRLTEPSPFSGFAAAPSPGNAGWPAPAEQPAAGFAWPSGSAGAPQPLAPGGSDFTRLMQSLSSSPSVGAAAVPADHSFFAPPSAGVPMPSHESEFTRVQRGSAQRVSGAVAMPSAPPAASKAASPGMALEPAKASPEPAAKPGKSKTLILLLVVMNALLLIALLVIGFLVLHKK